jgi:GxxExxY protein
MSVSARDLVDAKITQSIIAAFYEVFNVLGFGFVESVYVAALEWELKARGHAVGREIAVRVTYKGNDIAWQRMDIVVDGRIVIETKAGELISPNARLQLHNYLKATGLEVGLLLHFGPKPRFWRVFSPNHRSRPSDQSA